MRTFKRVGFLLVTVLMLPPAGMAQQTLPELQGGGYEGVTIRQVMQMRSGVDYEERYDFANPGRAASNHINALVKNTARFVDPARTLPRLYEPGQRFQYKTIDTAVLGWLVERTTDRSVAAYTASCLWEPLGAEADGYYIMDGPPDVTGLNHPLFSGLTVQ